MFAHLRRKTSCSVFSLNLSNRCQLHQNVASVSQLLNDENNKLDIPFANAKKGPFVQASPHLENGFEGDAFLKRNLQRILPKEVKKCVAVWYLHQVLYNFTCLLRSMSLLVKNCLHLVLGLEVTFTGKLL